MSFSLEQAPYQAADSPGGLALPGCQSSVLSTVFDAETQLIARIDHTEGNVAKL